jgi:hypothetical protein
VTRKYYDNLIKKYKTKQPGEILSTTTETRIKQKQRLTGYTQVCQVIMDSLKLEGAQREHAIWIVENIPLEYLHRTATNEMIIVSICFYVKKLFNPNVQFNDYAIIRHYGLTWEMVHLITCRIASFAFSHSYLVPIQTDTYNHEELYKGEYT